MLKNTRISSKDVKKFDKADKVVGSIYETSDFNQFELFENNRRINRKHVKDIKEGLKNGFKSRTEELLIILMNDGRKIVGDGNHRVVAARDLQKEGVPVKLRYTVKTEKEILGDGEQSVAQFIQKINNDRNDWPLEDMIRFWADEPSEDNRQESYKQLITLHDSEKYFPEARSKWRNIAIIICEGFSQLSTLKKGSFRSSMDNSLFEHYYDKIVKMADALHISLKNNYVEAFIAAWFKVKSTAEYDRFIDEHGFKGLLENLSKITVDTTASGIEYWEGIFKNAVKE